MRVDRLENVALAGHEFQRHGAILAREGDAVAFLVDRKPAGQLFGDIGAARVEYG
ncbi:MAG: hypothetical protein IPL47_10695 [Phyllobacteriaceae bacterium]|nr:hypothetical protein [Phyllobacteriaceae bacterium]